MVISLILILIIIYLNKRNNFTFQESKPNLSRLIKFISAQAVLIGHLFIFYMPDSCIKNEFDLGVLSVCVFFFYSGYGLTLSIYKKTNYLQSFLSKRLIKIFIPLIIAYLVYLLILLLLFNTEILLDEVLKKFFSSSPVLPYSWYVSELLILYFIFYILYLFCLYKI